MGGAGFGYSWILVARIMDISQHRYSSEMQYIISVVSFRTRIMVESKFGETKKFMNKWATLPIALCYLENTQVRRCKYTSETLALTSETLACNLPQHRQIDVKVGMKQTT